MFAGVAAWSGGSCFPGVWGFGCATFSPPGRRVSGTLNRQCYTLKVKVLGGFGEFCVLLFFLHCLELVLTTVLCVKLKCFVILSVFLFVTSSFIFASMILNGCIRKEDKAAQKIHSKLIIHTWLQRCCCQWCSGPVINDLGTIHKNNSLAHQKRYWGLNGMEHKVPFILWRWKWSSLRSGFGSLRCYCLHIQCSVVYILYTGTFFL